MLGCLASAPGSESGILLSTRLQAQSSQLTTRSALDHSAPRPHTQRCKFSGSALSSSQIFLGLLPAPLFRKAFPLCRRSYLPACFLLVKRLALIHLHKQEAPQSEVSLASAWLERVSAERTPCLISRWLGFLAFKVRVLRSRTSQSALVHDGRQVMMCGNGVPSICYQTWGYDYYCCDYHCHPNGRCSQRKTGGVKILFCRGHSEQQKGAKPY